MKKRLFLTPIVLLFLARWGLATEEMGKIDRFLEGGEISQAEALNQELFFQGERKVYYYFNLGKIHFYQGDYAKAEENLNRAMEFYPGDEKLRGFAEFYHQTKEIAQDFQEYQSEHFRLRLKGEDEILERYALEGLEKIYLKIGEELNFFPRSGEKILVEVYSTKDDFILASTLSKKDVETSGAIGICKFNRIMITSPRILPYGYRWLDTLSHEYVHLLVNRLSLYNCPLWLHEGIAKYFDQTWRAEKLPALSPSAEHLLASAVEENKLIPFSRMSPSLVKLDSQDEVALAFAEVASAVDYLIRNYGKVKIETLLGKFKIYNEYDRAFQETYGLNQDEIEKKWRENLGKTKLVKYPGVQIEKIEWEKDRDEVEKFVGADLRGNIRLGDSFRLRGMYEAASLEYEKALKKEPHNPVILHKLAKVQISTNKEKDAEENLKKAVETNPNYGAGYFTLGNLYLNQKKYEAAEKEYAEYLQINPFDPYLHKNLGLAFYSSGEKVEAEKEWQIAKKLLPDDPEINNLLNLPSP